MCDRPAFSAKAKYYVVLGNTEAAQGVEGPLIEEAKQILAAEIRKRPEFVLESAPVVDPTKLEAELKERGLQGLKMFVRLAQVRRQLLPPGTGGHRYQQIQVNVRAAIVGSTLPGDVMALSGDGESTASSEVSGIVKEKEVQDLARAALADALSQAVSKSAQKLTAPVQPEKKRRKRK